MKLTIITNIFEKSPFKNNKKKRIGSGIENIR